ncbi:MAG: hypothetical protein OEV46_10670, partial [Betaproteobacteria bacterium]|nr:hypothetical protein [Betaproteobacteria bacterium]
MYDRFPRAAGDERARPDRHPETRACEPGRGTTNWRSATMNVALALLNALKAHGGREIFGIPGDFA